MPRAFVVRPFGTKQDTSGRAIDFERVHRELIKPALEANGLKGDTTGEIVEAGNIREDMFRLILEADVVVADITVHNANVFYELGIRHSLRKKTTVLIKGEPMEDKTPFDLLTDRYLAYDLAEPAKRVADLTRAIGSSMVSRRETDSPIFQMIPALPEADPERVQVVPPDFQEEVARAASAKAKGWLRLLSDEVRGLRFERSGQKLVGEAQWKAKDYDGARQTWERVSDASPDDVAGNLALANIYERQSREGMRRPGECAELLKMSDRAIERILNNAATSRKDRAEALTLKGRNQKTHWRSSLDKATSVPERRQAAPSPALIESYESYLSAFRADLNHFYPGLGALQMGSILLDLSGESSWQDAFAENRAAKNYRIALKETVGSLKSAVPLSVKAALELEEGASGAKWARISEADVLFLTSDNDLRVEKAYQAAFTDSSPFEWDAARRQLELFADLGVKADRARSVIAAVAKVLGEEVKSPPTQVVVFAGHQVDAPGRAEPRFPPDREARARALIKSGMEQVLDPEHEFVGLGSASPGADILWHEVCGELGLKTVFCLPMPVADHAREVFGTYDDWRTRFLDLVQQKGRQVLTLSDRDGLPRWLEPTGIDPWVRGNEWVMQMALTWGADKVTLVAFWDGRDDVAGSSGTAQVVRLARDVGTVRLVRIDSTRVLA